MLIPMRNKSGEVSYAGSEEQAEALKKQGFKSVDYPKEAESLITTEGDRALDELSRDELNAHARSQGVVAPEKMRSKKEVIVAIARANGGDGDEGLAPAAGHESDSSSEDGTGDGGQGD